MKKTIIIVSLILAGIIAKAQTSLNDALQLLQQKNYISALDVCNGILAETPDNPSALGVRSQIHTAMGKFDLALADANKALSIDNNSDRAYFAKGEALIYGSKDFRQALQQYDAAIKANSRMTEAYAGKARALIGLQNNREALKVAEDALNMFPNNPELYYIRGLLNFQRGLHKSAVDDYDKALSLNNDWNTYQIYLNRGQANDALKIPNMAIQDFTKAIMADPNNAEGYVARGNTYYNISKYQEAAEDYRKAEVLSPDNSIITYNIGMAYYRDEDRASACRYFQKSCSQGNNNACRMLANCSDRRSN